MCIFIIIFNIKHTNPPYSVYLYNTFIIALFRNELEGYLSMLVRNFNVGAVEEMMCRNTLTVNWDGAIHDCDFNGQLDMSMNSIGRCFSCITT